MSRNESAIHVPNSTRIGAPMARRLRSPMARADSQLIPRSSVDATARRAEGRQAGRSEGEAFGSAGRLFDGQPVARQRLAADDVAQVVGEVLEGRERARLGVQVDEVEAPAELLAATVLAQDRKSTRLNSSH